MQVSDYFTLLYQLIMPLLLIICFLYDPLNEYDLVLEHQVIFVCHSQC